MERPEKTSIPFIGENKSCDYIEIECIGLTPTTNILWISPGYCTPYAIGPIPFMSTLKATPLDCQSCKFFSGNQLLKCAVNPKRIMDDDCDEFKSAC
jgi:hypothetical protein